VSARGRTVRTLILLALLSSWGHAGGARAHAPLTREILFAPTGNGLSVHMPDFGLMIGNGDATERSYAYACSGLLGMAPLDEQAAVAYRHDGSLLIGGSGGLLLRTAAGCDTGTDTGVLDTASVAAMAVHPDVEGLVYAATAGDAPALHRSVDGGEHWLRGATLAAGHAVTSMIVVPDDEQRLYMTQPSGADTVLLTSDDGGDSLAAEMHAGPLRLLALQPGTPPRLWAMAPDDAAREVAILVTDLPQVALREVHRVRFFGGLAIAGDGAGATSVWVGDEAGGLYRSLDGGQRFTNIAPDMAVACLTHAEGELWACAPGSSAQPAVAVSSDRGDSWRTELTLDDVDRLADCGPAQDVESQCGAEWDDWRFGGPLASAPPSGGDAGMSRAPAASTDTGAQEPGIDAGCSIARVAAPPSGEGASSNGAWALLCLIAGLARRRGWRRNRS